jgi:hypothetical protein
MCFRLNSKVVLQKGDKVRVSSGPYYLTSEGVKISLGEKGVGEFMSATPDGTAIYVIFSGTSNARYVYIGPEKVSEITGTILKPHKVQKVRNVKKQKKH